MGKLHFKFTYKKTPIEDENLFSMKQMKFQKFLPKKGFLNISIEKISNVKSLIESQNFEKNASLVSNREFYTCIYCEPFYEDEDLNSLFIGFETPAIYEKLAYGLNFIKNYAITMNSVILEYFQTKRLKLELRLFFKESEDYIILGYFEIPLIGLILNVNGLIDEDFCLKSENAQFCDVFVKINMSLTEKPLNIQNKLNVLPSKPFGIVLLQLIEIIYDEDAFEEFKEINFSLTFQQKTYKTGKFQIGNNTNGFVFLNNANFMMKTSNSQIFTLQPIEIKLIANENTVLGYLNIDFAETMKPVFILIKIIFL